MVVTTGGRSVRSSGASSYSSASSSSSAACLICSSRSGASSAAISSTSSSASDWVMVTIFPSPIITLMISGTVFPREAERSLTVTPGGTLTGTDGGATATSGGG